MTGKEKCTLLKQIRIDVANANNIDFTTADCPQPDGCIGTCPRCEAEAKQLDEAIDKIIASGGKVTIPETYYQMLDMSTVPSFGIKFKGSCMQRIRESCLKSKPR